jgi:hypothetical protein
MLGYLSSFSSGCGKGWQCPISALMMFATFGAKKTPLCRRGLPTMCGDWKNF